MERILAILPKLALLGAVFCACLITVLSLLPGSDLPSQSLNDKVNHFIAYGVLSFGAVLGRHAMGLSWTVTLVLAFGGVLEVLQGVMPYGRSASWLDVVANTCGVLIGTLGALATSYALAKLSRASDV